MKTMNPYALSQPLKKRLGSTLKPGNMKTLKRRGESAKQPKKRLKHEQVHKHANSNPNKSKQSPVLKQLTQFHAQTKPVTSGSFSAKPPSSVMAAFGPLGLIAAAAQEVSDKGDWALDKSQEENNEPAKSKTHVGYPLHAMSVAGHMQNVDLHMHLQRHAQTQLQSPKAVINPYTTVKPEEQSEEGRPETSARYTTTEEKALVHAKLRLQISSNMGQKNTGTDTLLTQYYEYYLKLLDPSGFMGYSKREKSALVRKFKSIKSKKPMLVEYLDTIIEKGFWLQLKEMVLSRPNLAIIKQ